MDQNSFWHVDLGNIIIVVTMLGTFFKLYGKFNVMTTRVDEMWDWFLGRTRDSHRREGDK